MGIYDTTMSRSFTQRPSVQTSGRGHFARGRGTNSVAMHSVQRTSNTSPLRGPRTTNNQHGQGEGGVNGEYGQPQNIAGRSGDQIPDRSRGQHREAYTVFVPDESKRQKVHEMARKESEQYEQFKQSTSAKSFNYVGKAGGVSTSEDQARLKQAEAVRTQKYARLQRQQQYKEDAKRQEEKSIAEKRAEARRKAEQNELREKARMADPEDLRKKREQFLNRLENNQHNY